MKTGDPLQDNESSPETKVPPPQLSILGSAAALCPKPKRAQLCVMHTNERSGRQRAFIKWTGEKWSLI